MFFMKFASFNKIFLLFSKKKKKVPTNIEEFRKNVYVTMLQKFDLSWSLSYVT